MRKHYKYLEHFTPSRQINYILSVRFPRFKNLLKNTEIIFDKPFTVLVGPNGAGKSSVLQAIYGCPQGQSVSDFWFSTDLDPIKEGDKEPNRFIYKYRPKQGMDPVEVIKTRAKRSQTKHQRADPDYWETAKPRKSDAMEPMPISDVIDKDIRTQTRWNPIKKKVVYIDFRSELSAFDKFFYFGRFRVTKRLSSKQDFMRARSKVLNRHITDWSGDIQKWNTKETSLVLNLTKIELGWVNKILGKEYVEAQYVEHTLFENDGYSIMFKYKNLTYSEAMAGSGEVAIVNCVKRVLAAENKSLILLDEPEVSLHPGAQYALKSFLLHMIKEKELQVVMSTHSEHFVRDLPNSCIKLFVQNKLGSYNVINSCSCEQAFVRLGGHISQRRKIIVEDKLAAHLVEEALKEIDDALLQTYSVEVYPGGGESILKHKLMQLSMDKDSRDVLFLDGDKSPKNPGKSYSGGDLLKSEDVAKVDLKNIDTILRDQTSINGRKFDLPLNGGDASNVSQQNKMKLKILDKFHEHVHFMSCDTPEELIWNVAVSTPFINVEEARSRYLQGSYKERIRDLAYDLYGESDATSEAIFTLQKQLFRLRNTEHEEWVDHVNKLKEVLGLIYKS